MLTKLTPCLMVSDVNRTVEYYRDILGFAFVGGVPPNSQQGVAQFDKAQPLAFAMMKQGNVEFMFFVQQSFVEELPQMRDRPIGATAELYIDLPDVRPLYQRLRNRVKIITDLHRTFYGKDEFVIQDCDGYYLCFASPTAETAP